MLELGDNRPTISCKPVGDESPILFDADVGVNFPSPNPRLRRQLQGIPAPCNHGLISSATTVPSVVALIFSARERDDHLVPPGFRSHLLPPCRASETDPPRTGPVRQQRRRRRNRRCRLKKREMIPASFVPGMNPAQLAAFEISRKHQGTSHEAGKASNAVHHRRQTASFARWTPSLPRRRA